jgi:hypothetical protein
MSITGMQYVQYNSEDFWSFGFGPPAHYAAKDARKWGNMDKKKDDELRDAMAEGISRGRRPVNAETRGRLKELLNVATEEDFEEAMRALGVEKGSERFLKALEI